MLLSQMESVPCFLQFASSLHDVPMVIHGGGHLQDSVKILLQCPLCLDDVSLGGEVEPVQPVQLCWEGCWWGGDGVVQDMMLLLHYVSKVCGQLRTHLRIGQYGGDSGPQLCPNTFASLPSFSTFFANDKVF